jgi:hypothetical protein
MSLLPALFNDRAGTDLITRQLSCAREARAGTELRVYQHFLESRALAEEDQLDTQAAWDAAHTALDAELSLLHDGLEKAGRSAAAVELVARKVTALANADNRRFARRFGG